MSKTDDPVQGYMFETIMSSDLAVRNRTVCQIVERVPDTEFDFEMGAAFLVRFGDGFETKAYANELSPWYPEG